MPGSSPRDAASSATTSTNLRLPTVKKTTESISMPHDHPANALSSGMHARLAIKQKHTSKLYRLRRFNPFMTLRTCRDAGWALDRECELSARCPAMISKLEMLCSAMLTRRRPQLGGRQIRKGLDLLCAGTHEEHTAADRRQGLAQLQAAVSAARASAIDAFGVRAARSAAQQLIRSMYSLAH
jgi:hypothetical protein